MFNLERVKEGQMLPRGRFNIFRKVLPNDKCDGFYVKIKSPFKTIGTYIDPVSFIQHERVSMRKVFLFGLRFPKYKWCLIVKNTALEPFYGEK